MDTRLKASPIQARTKGELKRLRKSGCIPISLQHRGEDTHHYQMALRPLLDFVRHHGESALLELDLGDGKVETALIHDVHRDGVTHLPTQITFMRVVQSEPIKAHVPLVFEGEPEPVSDGTAVLQPNLAAIDVRCLPRDLPENISVDVSQMQFGDVLHVSDIQLPRGVELLSAADNIVVSLASILRQTADEEEAEAPVAEDTAQEPVGEAEEEQVRAA